MKDNRIFDKFKSRLTAEAVIKACLAGATAGFIVGGLIALICWLCGYKAGVWIAIGAGAGTAVIAGLLTYFLKFKPSVRQAARRVDALGLEERAVTMLDYEEVDSYMASCQRDDARAHIDSVKASSLKMTMPKFLVAMTSCAAAFGITFSLVCGLYMGGVVSSPSGNVDPMESFIEATYIAEDGGEIDGETDQLLKFGEDATSVTAVALDGYVFVGWSDGNKNPGRTDLKVTADLEVTAMFESMNDGDNPEDGDFEGPGNEGDSASDQPADGSETDGSQGNEGDGNGSPGSSEGSGNGDQEGEGKGDGKGDGAGGKWSESNQIINGEIYYRDWLEQYYEEAMQEISSMDELPPELRKFIEAYFESV